MTDIRFNIARRLLYFKEVSKLSSLLFYLIEDLTKEEIFALGCILCCKVKLIVYILFASLYLAVY